MVQKAESSYSTKTISLIDDVGNQKKFKGYVVNTEMPQGRHRLKRIPKMCVNKGQRVQNSVFECLLDSAQLAQQKLQLLQEIDLENDSIRFYNLGNHYDTKIESYGKKQNYFPEKVLMI